MRQKKTTKTTSKSTIWSLRRGKYGRAPLKGTGRELQYEFNTYFQKIEKNTQYKDASSRYLKIFKDKVYCMTLQNAFPEHIMQMRKLVTTSPAAQRRNIFGSFSSHI